MKSNRLLFILIFFPAFLLLSSCVCKPDLISSLPVTLHPQETSMWCWAGSGQMVMHYLGNNVAQCTQANNRFGRTDCPCNQCGEDPVSNPPCVNGGWPEFDKYGFTFKRTNNTPLSWDELREELSQKSWCGKRPVAYSCLMPITRIPSLLKSMTWIARGRSIGISICRLRVRRAREF